jgi:hypothetical protein
MQQKEFLLLASGFVNLLLDRLYLNFFLQVLLLILELEIQKVKSY